MERRYAWFFALCLTVVSACSESPSGPDERRQLLMQVTDGVVVPTYQALFDRAALLSESAQAFCDTPSVSSLKSVREAWSSARSPLKQGDAFAFGPYADLPLRIGPKLDTWPARVSSIESFVSDGAPYGVEEVQSFGARAKGFPAVEYLLWGDAQGADQPDSILIANLSEGDAGKARCQALIGLSKDLAVQAAALRDAWLPDGGDFRSEVVDAGQGSLTFGSLRESVTEVFNRSLFAADIARSEKVGKPAGKQGTGEMGAPMPDLVESRFAHRSKQDLRDTLDGIRAVFQGTRDKSMHAYSFEAQIRLRDAALADDVLSTLGDAEAAIDAIELPLQEAVVEEPAQVDAAYQAIKAIYQILGVDVSNLLGLSVMFTDTDAD